MLYLAYGELELMNIVVFDIECCDGRNICSFGYVIADEKLNILEKRDIIINPRIGKIRVHRQAPPLPYPIGEFYAAKDFSYYYKEIRAILSSKEHLVFGFSTLNDAIFLNTACERYGLSHIPFKFYDCQRIYGKLHQQTQQIGLETAANLYDIPLEHIHKSDDDALTTLQVMQALCKEYDCDINGLLALDCGSYAYNKAEYIEYSSEWKKEKEIVLGENLKGVNLRIHSRAILWQHRFKQEGTRKGVTGKAFCFARLYERTHFKESIYLMKLINKYGGRYVSNAEKCAVFMAYGENGDRYLAVEQHLDTIEVVTLAQLLELLGTTKQEVTAGGLAIDLTRYLTKEDKLELEGKKTQIAMKTSPIV